MFVYLIGVETGLTLPAYIYKLKVFQTLIVFCILIGMHSETQLISVHFFFPKFVWNSESGLIIYFRLSTYVFSRHQVITVYTAYIAAKHVHEESNKS